MRKPRPLGLLVLALSLTAACGSTVNQGAGGTPVGGGQGLAVDPGATAGDLYVPGSASEGASGPTTASGGAPAGASGGGAAGAGSTTGGGGATTNGTSSGTASTGGAAAAVTAPLKVGFFTTDFNKAAAAIAGGSGSSTTADAIWKRLVVEQNSRGGVGGRKIEGEYYVQDGTSNNYPADYQAACEYFARDKKVAIVVAGSIPDVDFAACLLKAGIPTINPSHSGPDRASWSRVPGLLLPPGVSYDAAAATIIDRMREAGLLTTKDKVGVILSECPNVQQVYRDVIAPRLKKYGIGVDAFTANECIKGFSGAASVGNGASSAVLRFKTNGVTQVMPLLASLENLMTGLFSQAAENQGYRPGYILSTGARAEELKQGGTIPVNQFKNMKGVGWNPAYDLYTMSTKLPPRGEACLKFGREAGVTPASATERATLVLACDPLYFLDAVLTKTRGVSDLQTFVGTARSLTDYVSTATPGQPGDFRDIDNTEFGQIFAADPSCTCIRYTSGAVRIAH